MAPLLFDQPLSCYRIGDPHGAYPIFDAGGSVLAPGRWNSAATPVIYAARHLSTAMLEKLAYFNGIMPKNQSYIEIRIPKGVPVVQFDPSAHSGWDAEESIVAREFGVTWWHERASAVLLVPSVVVRTETNVVLNPNHPQFSALQVGPEQPLHWDRRIFGG